MIKRILLQSAAIILLFLATPAVAQLDRQQGVSTANTLSLIGRDEASGAIAPAQVLVDEFGFPVGVLGSPLQVGAAALPLPENAASETGGNLAKIAEQTGPGGALSPSGSLSNPISTLTRPNDTAPYAQYDLIASSTTAGSIEAPAFEIANDDGGAIVRRVRLVTNATTGWGGALLRVRLFTLPPTYTNGDNGAYALATGSANYIGRFDVTLEQVGDGAMGIAAPGEGNGVYISLTGTGGVGIYWDIQYLSAGALTPVAQQTFTLTPELQN
jgi:hypothetical protein